MFFSVISVVKINREERGGRGDFLFFSVVSVRSVVKINREERGGHGDFLFSYVVSVCYAVEINHEVFFINISYRGSRRILYGCQCAIEP